MVEKEMILPLISIEALETIDITPHESVLRTSLLETTVVSLTPSFLEVEQTLLCSCILTGTRLSCISCIEGALKEKTLMTIALTTMESTISMKKSLSVHLNWNRCCVSYSKSSRTETRVNRWVQQLRPLLKH